MMQAFHMKESVNAAIITVLPMKLTMNFQAGSIIRGIEIFSRPWTG
jgi:hypothetical protein